LAGVLAAALVATTASATVSDGLAATTTRRAPPPAPGLRLAFDDEFNGPPGAPPNPANWAHQTGGWGWGSGELETYTDSLANAHLDGAGHLLIIARKQTYTGADGITRHYTSARLVVRPLLFTYGYVEARLKLPCGQGLWPAFWALGGNPDGIDWPIGGEFDIVEWISQLGNHIAATAHGPVFGAGQHTYDGLAGHWQLSRDQPLAAVCGVWHTYGVLSRPGELSWYVDGRRYFEVTRKMLKPGQVWPFGNAFHVILDLAVGGWPGAPSGTAFPATMEVDFVRIYLWSGSGAGAQP
ncbi:MAG: glycoside hydrolase family 16 protein, partial [Mycobacteriales bacterium]